jgi:hypothetical protein
MLVLVDWVLRRGSTPLGGGTAMRCGVSESVLVVAGF